MNDLKKYQKTEDIPQCQFFVQRKKRQCRMTVRPGKRYCGEHEPEPQNKAGEPDVRVPCPLDQKHTCYVSKLEKHLQICNARQGDQPEYIVPNINCSDNIVTVPRKPLNQIPEIDLLKLIDKVNSLHAKLIEGQITTIPQQDIHEAVHREFNEADRTESSRRHLRQASSLLQLMEAEGLVRDDTCYVELGAGKGQLSYYACTSWCRPPAASLTLLVDRAALRHKRDNKLTGGVKRLRADLAHLRLAGVGAVARRTRIVGFAKHLCGVATDYALRCITAQGVLHKTRGIVLATCCHHRIERADYVAKEQMQELGITAEEMDIMLGIVSWATCGDGRSREKRNENSETIQQNGEIESENDAILESATKGQIEKNDTILESGSKGQIVKTDAILESASNGQIVKNAAIMESSSKGQIEKNDATLDSGSKSQIVKNYAILESASKGQIVNSDAILESASKVQIVKNDSFLESVSKDQIVKNDAILESGSKDQIVKNTASLSQEYREEVGRRAKAILDWGRVLYLRDKGFDARLCHYVPSSVSLENVCIVAKKVS